jgi:DNA-binding transcriptional LysR family regulator
MSKSLSIINPLLNTETMSEPTSHQLRAFIAVAEERSFTRAASRLHVTTPALSQQIGALERRLGVRALHRTSRSVELTTAGEALLPLARAVVAALDRVSECAALERSMPLRIGIPDSWPVVSQIIEAYALRDAAAPIELLRTGFTDGVAALEAGRIDVALVPGMECPSAAGMSTHAIWRESRLLLTSARHRLADRPSIRLNETNQERFVSFGDPEALAAWYVVPRSDGSRPRIDQVVDSYIGILDLCAAGLAVHIVGASGVAGHARADLRYVPIEDAGDATIWLISPRRSQHAEVSSFLATAIQVVGTQDPASGIRPADATTRGPSRTDDAEQIRPSAVRPPLTRGR